MKILFFRAGSDILSLTISALTRGQYVHAAVLTEVDPQNPLEIIEAYYPKVHKRNLEPKELPRIDAFEFVPALTPAQAELFTQFLATNMGDKYSIIDLFRFLPAVRAVIGDETPKGFDDNKFCSALVLGAALHAGVKLLTRCSPWEISPTVLSYSPLLSGPVLFPSFSSITEAPTA